MEGEANGTLTHDVNNEIFANRVALSIKDKALVSAPITAFLNVADDQCPVAQCLLTMILRQSATICLHADTIERRHVHAGNEQEKQSACEHDVHPFTFRPLHQNENQ